MATALEHSASLTDAPLTVVESNRLAVLEGVIRQGVQTFVDVGRALTEIRESKLYRQNFPTFDAYCQEKWGFSRQRAYQLIGASEVSENLDEEPTNERQTRTLLSLPKEEQKEAWAEAKVLAQKDGLEKPTGKHVDQAVRARIEPKPEKKPEPKAEPEPEYEPEEQEADLAAELKIALKENDALRAELETLTLTDKDKTIRSLMAQKSQIGARLQQEIERANKAEEQNKWYRKLLIKSAEYLGLGDDLRNVPTRVAALVQG